jgi:WD40 repeat protein
MLFVPAAVFEMGSPGAEKGNPLHLVSLDGYWIDRTEVTNRAFAAFLNSFPNLTPASAAQWFDPWLENSRLVFADGQWKATEGYEGHPVSAVNWPGAQAYCRWAGARLPTEAEWELAARSPEGQIYPTGEVITCEQANVCGAEPAPVGSFSADASPYGLLDMGGNVMEWVSDWFYPYYFESEVTHNPKGPLYGVNKVLRGGFYLSAFPAYDRMEVSPSFADPGAGFRCAISAYESSPPAYGQFFALEACAQSEGDVAWTECVTGLTRREDGTVLIHLFWDVSSEECVTQDVAAELGNFYLVDEPGNRIDPTGFVDWSGKTCVKNSVGQLIFPKLSDQSTWVVLYDDNLGVSTSPFQLPWVVQAVSGVQPTFAPTPRPLAERFQQVYTFLVTAGVADLAWSPDGRSLLVETKDGSLVILDASSGSPWPPLDAGGMQVHATGGAWSPDGSRLAVSDGGEIYMFDGQGSTFFYSLTPPAAVRQLFWSPDGKTLAAVLQDGTLRLFSASAAQMTRTFNQFAGVSFAAWSPDGDKLAVQAADGLHLVRSADSQPLAHWDSILAPAWSPDGVWVAGYFLQQVILESAATGERLAADSSEFSPAGGALLAWAPGGDYFVTAHMGEIVIWSIGDQLRQRGSLPVSSGVATSLDFSPDGSYLASGGDDGSIIIWSIGAE